MVPTWSVHRGSSGRLYRSGIKHRLKLSFSRKKSPGVSMPKSSSDPQVVVVTLFPTKIHENTHMYNTLTVVSPQNVRMYFVSGCQKKLRLIELAAATCYLQFCRATARTGPEEMTHWHPGGRFKESFSSNGFHNIYSIILSRIISRYVPFHQMSF